MAEILSSSSNKILLLQQSFNSLIIPYYFADRLLFPNNKFYPMHLLAKCEIKSCLKQLEPITWGKFGKCACHLSIFSEVQKMLGNNFPFFFGVSVQSSLKIDTFTIEFLIFQKEIKDINCYLEKSLFEIIQVKRKNKRA